MDRKDWILPPTPPEEAPPEPEPPVLKTALIQASPDAPRKRRVGRPRKKRRGRPPIPYDGRESFKTRLHPAVVTLLRKLGGGWANHGIERLAAEHVKREQAQGGNETPK